MKKYTKGVTDKVKANKTRTERFAEIAGHLFIRDSSEGTPIIPSFVKALWKYEQSSGKHRELSCNFVKGLIDHFSALYMKEGMSTDRAVVEFLDIILIYLNNTQSSRGGFSQLGTGRGNYFIRGIVTSLVSFLQKDSKYNNKHYQDDGLIKNKYLDEVIQVVIRWQIQILKKKMFKLIHLKDKQFYLESLMTILTHLLPKNMNPNIMLKKLKKRS